MADWFVNSRIRDNKVTVFVREGCSYSRNVMDILMEYNFAPGALERVDITRRQDIQDYFHQRCKTSAAVSLEMGNFFSSWSPSPPQRAENTADENAATENTATENTATENTDAETKWCCPICRDNEDDISYMMPCHHQFCFCCAARWLTQNTTCPICRDEVTDVLLQLQLKNMEGYTIVNIQRLAESSAENHQNEQEVARTVPVAQVGGLPPHVWVDFFKSHPDHTRPLIQWWARELTVLAPDSWDSVAALEAIVVNFLCLFGLDEEALLSDLQPFLKEHSQRLVHRIITCATRQCGSKIQQYLAQQELHAARGEDEDPAVSISPTTSEETIPTSQQRSYSSAGSDVEEQASTEETTLPGTAGHSSSVPVPALPNQPQQETETMVVASPSAPGQENMPARPKHAPNRGATNPEVSPQPCKKTLLLQEEASTSGAPIHGEPSSPPTAPVPESQDQPQQETGAGVVAGTSGPGEDNVPRGSKRPAKKRATSPQDSPRSCKRPHRLEDEASTSGAPIHGGPSSPPTAPVPEGQDQPQQETGAGVVASTSGPGEDNVSRASKRPAKKRATSPQDSPRSCKRPHRLEDEASTSGAPIHGGPSSPPTAPVPEGQDQPQQETGAGVVAGTSAPGEDNVPRGSKRPTKRRATSPRDSP